MSRLWRGRAFLGMSVDGFIAREDGDIAWLEQLPTRKEHQASKSLHPALEWETFFPSVDALVMGRGTYEKVLTFGEWPFAGLPVAVLSSSLGETAGPVEAVRSVEAAVTWIEAQGAKDVYVDGGLTVQQFLGWGLLDELTVSIAPVILGAGKSLFSDLGRDVSLVVQGSHVTSEGMVRITYQVEQAR